MDTNEWIAQYEDLEMAALKATPAEQAEMSATIAQTLVFLGKAMVRSHARAAQANGGEDATNPRNPRVVRARPAKAPKVTAAIAPEPEPEPEQDEFETESAPETAEDAGERKTRGGKKALVALREWFNDLGVGAELTTSDIANAAGCSLQLASQRGKVLEKAGVLERVGRGKFRLVLIPAA